MFDSYIDPEQTKYPGIGRYHLEQELMLKTTRAPAFTMSHKTKPIDLRHTIEAQNKNPSPADYENNPEMSKTLYSSHFKKTSFSQSKSKRFFSKGIPSTMQMKKYQDQATTKIRPISQA